MKMKSRCLSLILVIAMCFSLFVFTAPTASAVDGSDYVYTPEPARNVAIRNQFALWLNAKLGVNYFAIENVLNDFYFNNIVGEVSMEQLKEAQRVYNWGLASMASRVTELYPKDIISSWFSHAAITEDVANGIFRLVDDMTGEFITDINGDFPFVRVAGDVFATQDPSVEPMNKWIRLDNLSNLPGVVVLSEVELARTVAELNKMGTDCSLYGSGDFYFIKKDKQSFYANFAGKPYVATRTPSAADTVRPPITEDNIIIENNNGLVIDKNEGILNLIDQMGDTIGANIENLEFDFGSNYYTANVSIPIDIGGITINQFYTYNITYNITNTYITYIGSNEPYEREEYTLYYQLPDGRSSADLTADEVAGMSFEFYDVVNYKRSTDNVSVRSLYHFDGNLDDSSYFTGQSSGFVWEDGASITYMESPGAFEGNLYLDNTAHSFSISQPSNFAKNDFTIQFRYYQASEIDTQNNVENSLSGSGSVFSNTTLLKWDESSLYDMDGNYLAALPIGTWNEIAIVRHQGYLIYYLNGHCIGHSEQHVAMSSFLCFDFGSTSRAYSMIDELRVLNFALVEGGTDYTPTTVPYDSNLVLVLPGAARPIADEYYVLTPDENDLLGGALDFRSVLVGDTSHSAIVPAAASTSPNVGILHELVLTYNPQYSFIDYVDGGLVLSANSGPSLLSGARQFFGGYFIDLNFVKPSTTYTVDIVRSDYSVDSFTFTTGTFKSGDSYMGPCSYNFANRNINESSQIFDWGTLYYDCFYVRSGSSYYANTGLLIYPSSNLDVAYISLVEDTESAISIEKITAIYDSDELVANTAAIQTAIPVNGYTVGGIRPTMPERGDCWFPVMENRITSVQIYTGTHWEEVNARWWTGSRWIPIYAFDINTLEDLFDIADSDGVVVPLPDQNSFLRWWQLQWLDFRSWLDGRITELIAAVGGGGGSIDIETPDEDGNVQFSPLQLIDTILGGLLEIAKDVIAEFAGLVVDLFKMFVQALLVFVGGIGDVFSSGLIHFSTLSDGLSGIGDFVSGVYDAIPDDIQVVLTASFVVIVSVSLLAFLL